MCPIIIRCEDEQNMVAFQHRGDIYYRTFKDIQSGQELMVWYGEEYAKDLGLIFSPLRSKLTTNYRISLIRTLPWIVHAANPGVSVIKIQGALE